MFDNYKFVAVSQTLLGADVIESSILQDLPNVRAGLGAFATLYSFVPLPMSLGTEHFVWRE